jgi:hypothetical protein
VLFGLVTRERKHSYWLGTREHSGLGFRDTLGPRAWLTLKRGASQRGFCSCDRRAAAVSTVVPVLTLPVVWLKSGWTLTRRVRHTLVLVVLAMAIVVLKQWNALGLHYY